MQQFGLQVLVIQHLAQIGEMQRVAKCSTSLATKLIIVQCNIQKRNARTRSNSCAKMTSKIPAWFKARALEVQ